MRKLPIILLSVIATILLVASCKSDSTWKDYTDIRNANLKWLAEQVDKKGDDGKPYYTVLRPAWDTESYVLIKYFNDTMLTKDNLKPYLTSTVDVKYHGRLYDDTPFDSSYLNTSPADSIFRTKLDEVVSGWTIALTHMHIGDTCEVIIPYSQGYGSQNRTTIPPYSVLRFGIKLVGIPKLEK